MALSPNISVMTKAVREVSRALVRDFAEVEKLQISKKGAAGFVTSADHRTEKKLYEMLSEARKGFGFLMEEQGEVKGSDPNHRWVIDPIDGTSNFIHAIPYFCISIALEKKNAQGHFEALAGVIYDPIHDELFAAEKGKGAVCNGMKLRVSSRDKDLMVSCASPRKDRKHYKETLDVIHRAADHGITVRCTGAAALDLAYVAAGRFDAIWYHSLQPWDLAAGILIVEEAGGKVTSVCGGKDARKECNVFASNGVVHSLIQPLLMPSAA